MSDQTCFTGGDSINDVDTKDLESSGIGEDVHREARNLAPDFTCVFL